MQTMVVVAILGCDVHAAPDYRSYCSMMPGQTEKSRRADGDLSMGRELTATLAVYSTPSISADVTKQPNMASTMYVLIANNNGRAVPGGAEAVVQGSSSRRSCAFVYFLYIQRYHEAH